MSLWNHYSNLTDAVFAKINDPGILFGDPAPRASEDIHAFWNDWINRGWFPWESEGYPHSGNFYHTQSWWRFRHLENVLFVHFNDLLDDPCAEIARIADHLSIVVSDRALDKIVDATRFASIKINAAHAAPMRKVHARETWAQGLDTFFFKGTNGRWKNMLTEAELLMHERAKASVLTPDCAHYTETVRAAWPG